METPGSAAAAEGMARHRGVSGGGATQRGSAAVVVNTAGASADSEQRTVTASPGEGAVGNVKVAEAVMNGHETSSAPTLGGGVGSGEAKGEAGSPGGAASRAGMEQRSGRARQEKGGGVVEGDGVCEGVAVPVSVPLLVPEPDPVGVPVLEPLGVFVGVSEQEGVSLGEPV